MNLHMNRKILAAQAGFDVIEAAKRAIERATAMTGAELKRGIGALATIGSTAPFVGLFGTVFGIIHAFETMAVAGGGGLGNSIRRYCRSSLHNSIWSV